MHYPIDIHGVPARGISHRRKSARAVGLSHSLLPDLKGFRKPKPADKPDPPKPLRSRKELRQKCFHPSRGADGFRIQGLRFKNSPSLKAQRKGLRFDVQGYLARRNKSLPFVAAAANGTSNLKRFNPLCAADPAKTRTWPAQILSERKACARPRDYASLFSRQKNRSLWTRPKFQKARLTKTELGGTRPQADCTAFSCL